MPYQGFAIFNPRPPAQAEAAKTEAARVAEDQPITVLKAAPPSATNPTEGLPANPVPGRFYTFASRPSTLYVMMSDNVWRAVLLVQVV